jgi:hypothetical protein
MITMTRQAVLDLARNGFMSCIGTAEADPFVLQQQQSALVNMKRFYLNNHTNLVQYCGWSGAEMSRVAMELGMAVQERPGLVIGFELVQQY